MKYKGKIKKIHSVTLSIGCFLSIFAKFFTHLSHKTEGGMGP